MMCGLGVIEGEEWVFGKFRVMKKKDRNGKIVGGMW